MCAKWLRMLGITSALYAAYSSSKSRIPKIATGAREFVCAIQSGS